MRPLASYGRPREAPVSVVRSFVRFVSLFRERVQVSLAPVRRGRGRWEGVVCGVGHLTGMLVELPGQTGPASFAFTLEVADRPAPTSLLAIASGARPVPAAPAAPLGTGPNWALHETNRSGCHSGYAALNALLARSRRAR